MDKHEKSWEDLLMLYLTGELSAEDRARFERYLVESDDFRQDLDEWRRLVAAVREEADSRVGQLPPLSHARYRNLPSKFVHYSPTPNGQGHSDLYQSKEEKIPMLDTMPIGEPNAKPLSRQKQPFTLAAALLAVIILGTILLYMSARPPSEPDKASLGSGDVEQGRSSETPTPLPTFTVTASFTPTPISSAFPTFTMTPTITITPSFTPTPISTATALPPMLITNEPFAEFDTSLPATVAPPVAIEPVVSAPAELARHLQLPLGDLSRDVDWSADGQTLAVLGSSGVWLYDVNNFDGAARLLVENGVGIVSSAFSPEGSLLATQNSAGGLTMWDVESGSPITSVSDFGVGQLQFISDGIIFDQYSGQQAQFVDETLVTDAEPTIDIPGYYVISPNGKTVAVSSGEGTIVLLDATTNEEIHRFDTLSNPIQVMSFNAEGTVLAIGDSSGIVTLLDVVTGETIVSMNQQGRVHGIAFSPDGTLVAATFQPAENFNILWLWNLETGERFAVLVYMGELTSPVFSPDGTQLVVSGGSVIILDVTAAK